MRIENYISNAVPFADLPMGHVFFDNCGNWYLKCESVMCEDTQEPINAVSIENGELEFFELKQDVWPVNGKFVAESFGIYT